MDKEALFENMQIDMSANFRKKVEFKGPANFRSISVGQTIYFGDDASFDDSVTLIMPKSRKTSWPLECILRTKHRIQAFLV